MSRQIALALALGLTLAASGAQAGVEENLTKAGCMACHSKDKKMIGPSFKDIAAKYKGQDAVAPLMLKVRTGGKGVFGPIPMPPNPPEKINDADLKEAVQFILKS